MICVKIESSARQPGVWLYSISVDGSRLWCGEEGSRYAAMERVAVILLRLDEQQPAGEREFVSNI